jgi:NAD-dependent dihydropyrimidine dehydrogenase PreA subunit
MKKAGKQLKHKEPGLFHPVIDRTRCDGGHHHECKEKNSPCISGCPNSVLEIRKLNSEDKKGLGFGEKLRILVHDNRQSYAVMPQDCTACGECVAA